MNAVRNILLSFVVAGLCVAASNAEDVKLPPDRASEQLRQADAVLLFAGPDRIYFTRPPKANAPFKLAALPARIAAATQQRGMILVIMGKGTHIWPDDKFKTAVDDLEARLKRIGFRKVVFYLASGTYPMPIYREWPSEPAVDPIIYAYTNWPLFLGETGVNDFKLTQTAQPKPAQIPDKALVTRPDSKGQQDVTIEQMLKNLESKTKIRNLKSIPKQSYYDASRQLEGMRENRDTISRKQEGDVWSREYQRQQQIGRMQAETERLRQR